MLDYDKKEVEKIMSQIHVDVFEKYEEKVDNLSLAIIHFNVVNGQRIIHKVKQLEGQLVEVHKIVTQRNFKTIYFEGKQTAMWYAFGKFGIGSAFIGLGIIIASFFYFNSTQNEIVMKLPSNIKENEKYYIVNKKNIIINKNEILIKK